MFEGRFFELLIIFVLALVVLGPEKLPRVVSEVGRWVGRARAMARQFREQLEEEVVLEETRRTQAAAPPRPEPAAPPPPPAYHDQPSTPEMHANVGAPEGTAPPAEGQQQATHAANAAHAAGQQETSGYQADAAPTPYSPGAGPESHSDATAASPEPHTHATAPGTEPHANASDSNAASHTVNGTDHEAYASPAEPRMTQTTQPLHGSNRSRSE